MNEKLKELAEQADEYAEQTVHYYQGQFYGLTWEGKIKQTRDTKFAELIVEECINEIAYIGKANEVSGDRTDRGGLNHILWTTETAIEKIKQHFGVDNERNDGHENIIRGVEIHSDKGYKVATVEDYEEFIKNRK